MQQIMFAGVIFDYMQFEFGKKYWVPCAELMMLDDGKIFYVPVYNHGHKDEQFNFPYEHYHVDGRFFMKLPMRQQFQCWNGYTNRVVLTEDSKDYSFMGITECKLTYQRHVTGLEISLFPRVVSSENFVRYHQWYNTFVGKTCKGRKCPHYGTEMIEQNGELVCPMHGLRADIKSQLVVDLC